MEDKYTLDLFQKYEEKFRLRCQKKIDPTKDCDAWTAQRDKDGYGRIGYHGKPRSAHHAIWYLSYGYWPEYLLHTCDTPGCVNIEHLREGTHQDNVDDMVAKNRHFHPKGESNGRAKFTDTQVEGVLSLKGSGLLQREVADMYGMSHQHVSQIWNKKYRAK